MFVPTLMAERLVYDDSTNRLQAAVLTDYSREICVAVRTSRGRELFSIVNKVVDSLSRAEILKVSAEHEAYPETSFSLRRIEKRRALENLQFISYVCRVNEEVSEYDFGKKLCFCYAMGDDGIVKIPGPPIDYEYLAQIIHPDDLPGVVETCRPAEIARVVREQSEIYFECRRKSSGTEYRWYSYALQGIAGAEGEAGRLMIFKRDIDSAKRGEMRQREALKSALSKVLFLLGAELHRAGQSRQQV